ncbi:MAG: acetylornithine deacetylase [Emcibacter sp.]|nr:acetylornithine deacetylase [Emcibacter sp.]
MIEYSTNEMLSKLISFDTTSWKSNLDLIDFVESYLKIHHVPTQVIYNEEKSKANIFATIGPDDVAGIILSGHTDVVPVTEQNWSHDPFDMKDSDGRLYGRGTSDMKGFIACVLAAVPRFVRADLKEPLHIALSYDEETGCTGVLSLMDYVSTMPVKARACIVGEPTSMKVVNAHKGVFHLLTRIHGIAAHSSTDQGVNTVMYAADMIAYLNNLAQEMKERIPLVEGFDPPYTTIHVGRIKGGAAANVTPSYCEFEWDFRPMPGPTADEILTRFKSHVTDYILPSMKERCDKHDSDKVTVTTDIMSVVPPLLPQTGSSAETLVMALANQNDVSVVSYGTEAGIFQEKGGIATVVCGPGNIEQAHRPNEYIEKTQLEACDEFLGRLLNVMKVSG